MKKNILHSFLNIVCLVLIICFIVFVIIDYSKYDESFSAPFSVNIFIRMLEFLLPGVVIFIVSKLSFKRKK